MYTFDLYSIALSKIARGFEADLEDVVFMIKNGLIELRTLETLFEAVLPKVLDFDISPSEFRGYFDEVRRML